MGAEDDGYNAKAPYDFRRHGGWNYRVIAWPDTEPGSAEGQRHRDSQGVLQRLRRRF